MAPWASKISLVTVSFYHKKAVPDDKQSEPDRKTMVRLRQKSTSQTKYFMHRFEKSKQMVLNPFKALCRALRPVSLLRSTIVLLDIKKIFNYWESGWQAL